jgi:hypothetical protein
MNNNDLENIKLHIAGATVLHTPPFDSLKPFKNSVELSKDFIDKWVIPYYMKIGSTDSDWLNQLTLLKSEITTDIIEKNLGDFNWRTRQTGAFFSAVTNQTQYIDIIGIHLLKSEVCYTGSVYCQVLASFNLPKCVDYLNIYLDYYLTKPDLWFDQRDALEAICYLDKLNATHHFDKHLENWGEFLKNKPHWEKEISTDKLENQINFIESIRKFAG